MQQSDRRSAYRKLLGMTSNAHELFWNWQNFTHIGLLSDSVGLCACVDDDRMTDNTQSGGARSLVSGGR